MSPNKIGILIYKRRKDKNLSQQELADKLGVTDRAISNWENGKRLPDYVYLKDLCDILDISIEEFMEGHINRNYSDTKEYYLLQIKSYQDGIMEDYWTIDTLVKIDGSYKDISLLLQNKQVVDNTDNTVTYTRLKDKAILLPFIKIDSDFKYMKDYNSLLPINIDKEIDIDLSEYYDTKTSILNNNIVDKVSKYFNKEIVRHIFDEVINLTDEDMENDDYYGEYDYYSKYISTIKILINNYLNDLDNHLEDLFILRSIMNLDYVPLYHEIYNYIK